MSDSVYGQQSLHLFSVFKIDVLMIGPLFFKVVLEAHIVLRHRVTYTYSQHIGIKVVEINGFGSKGMLIFTGGVAGTFVGKQRVHLKHLRVLALVVDVR